MDVDIDKLMLKLNEICVTLIDNEQWALSKDLENIKQMLEMYFAMQKSRET